MNIDAHYYAILAFARAVGFKKKYAHIIAYASQFVDDAKVNHIVLNKKPNNIEYDIISNEPSFFNMATCHSYFKINTFNYEAMINNTTAFHFVPGCKGENFAKKLRCSEESPIILDFLEDVIKEDNIAKLGIVLHAYADTFSHQGFSGIISKVNDIKDCRPNTKIHNNILESFIEDLRNFIPNSFDDYFDRLSPAYGHAQALTYPDIPYLEWEYMYDYSDEFSQDYIITKINNKERYIEAFEKIKIYLEKYLYNNPKYKDESFSFNDFKLLYKHLVQKDSTKTRIKNWKNVMIDQKLFSKDDINIINYNEELWLKEAFNNYNRDRFRNRKVEGVELNTSFENSNWYMYYKAVKWYKNQFFRYAKKHSLEIPR